MGILALAQIALAETGPEAERGDVRSVNGGVVVLYEGAETLEDEEIWRDAGSDLETSAASAATDAWIATAPMLRLMANSATPAFDINVDSELGVFSLFGTVPTKPCAASPRWRSGRSTA